MNDAKRSPGQVAWEAYRGESDSIYERLFDRHREMWERAATAVLAAHGRDWRTTWRATTRGGRKVLAVVRHESRLHVLQVGTDGRVKYYDVRREGNQWLDGPHDDDLVPLSPPAGEAKPAAKADYSHLPPNVLAALRNPSAHPEAFVKPAEKAWRMDDIVEPPSEKAWEWREHWHGRYRTAGPVNDVQQRPGGYFSSGGGVSTWHREDGTREGCSQPDAYDLVPRSQPHPLDGAASGPANVADGWQKPSPGQCPIDAQGWPCPFFPTACVEGCANHVPPGDPAGCFVVMAGRE